MNFKIFILLIIGAWLGLLFGISFVEAPLKFQAPGITMKLGVGIGQLVFGVSHKIQIGFFILIVFYFIKNGKIKRQTFWPTLLLLTSLITIQSFYLFPILDERAMNLLNDQPSESSSHHLIFILTEIAKLILITILFFKTYRHA